MTRKELRAENKRLRRQVVDLHAELTILRARQTYSPLTLAPPAPRQWPAGGISYGDAPGTVTTFSATVQPNLLLGGPA
jgi:hypothetical protein